MSALEKININNHVDSNQNTALHIAALFGQANMVKLLLKKGADINRKNRVGFTPLHFAAIHGSENTIKALANNPDCDLLIQGGADAQTALHQAVMYNKTGSIKALLNRAKINQQLEEMLNSTDAKGQTARDLATQKNNQEAIELLQP
jgi:ankyrin repeat protein